VVPLIIYAFFLHNVTDSSTIRKIGWVFFIIIYLGLWITDQTNGYAYIYFWTMIASLMLLFLDGTISRALVKQEAKEQNKDNMKDYQRDLLGQLDKLRNDLKNNIISPSEFRRVERKLRKRLKALGQFY
jgi:hypothetical protein